MSRAEAALADAAILKCESLCSQALIAKGNKVQERLRNYTSACASALGGPWEGRMVAALADLVTDALATPSAASAAASTAVDGASATDTRPKEKEKKDKGKKEKKEKKEKGSDKHKGKGA